MEWLLEDDAPCPTAELQDFADIALPPGLGEDTLALIQAERDAASGLTMPSPTAPPPEPLAPANDTRPWWRSPFAFAGLAAAAAALLVVQLGPPEVGDPAQFTPRGSELNAPPVHMEMSTWRDGELERLSTQRSLRAGDRLFFRYKADRAAHVHLVHLDPSGLELLHTQSVQPGSDDLRLDGEPLYWQIDAGDPSGTFALISAESPLSAEQLQLELQSADDPDALCRAALARGRYCDARTIQVTP